jgi:hypothetical protein
MVMVGESACASVVHLADAALRMMYTNTIHNSTFPAAQPLSY